MATRQEIESALAVYEQRGNLEAARKLKATLAKMTGEGTSIADPKPAPAPDLRERILTGIDSAAEKVAGTAETAASLVTGTVAAPLAGLGGGIYETARQILNGEFNANDTRSVDEFAARAAQQATYEPRTATGQAQVQAIGKAIEPIADDLPALNAIGVPTGSTLQGVKGTASVARAATEATGIPAAAARTAEEAAAAARAAGTKVADAGKAAASKVSAAFERAPESAPAAGPRSAGAAEVAAADVRRANAAELGFTDDARLTKGQATQEPTEIGFEREQAKNLERGAEIRQRYENQARVAENVFDKFVDQTGGSVPDFSGGGKVGLGTKVQKALESGATSQKNKVRAEFKRAEKEEGNFPTVGDDLAAYFEKDAAALGGSPIMKYALRRAKELKILDKDKKGLPTDIKTLYQLRRDISENTPPDGTNAAKARNMKDLLDERIAADGGPLYKQATESHRRFKAQYRDASLIKGIIENKPGSPDRIIAADQVLNRVLSEATGIEEVRHMRRLLQTHGGEEGVAAWNDIKAGGIEYLRDAAYKGAKPGPNGTLRPNATQLNRAVSKLDQSGKLDFMYGKAGAEKIRLARDIMRAIENTEGANYSGTGNVVIEFLESLPVAGPSVAKGRKLAGAVNGLVRDDKLKKRIRENLE